MRRYLNRQWLVPAALLAVLLFPPQAQASISVVGFPPAFYTGLSGLVARMDVAYDQTNKVYLSVWCTFQTVCRAQFLSAGGAAIGSGFELAAGAGFARAAWGNDGTFVVAYTPTNSLTRYIRFLRYTPSGQPEWLTGPILLATLGNITETESDRATMVYVPSSNHFLITWWEWYHGGLPQTYVAAYRSDGTKTVNRTQVTDGTDGQSNPDLSCDFGSGRCLAAGFGWGEALGGAGASWAQFIDASSGQRIGPVLTVSGGQRAEDQSVDYNNANAFVVSWVNARSSVRARRVNQNMTLGPDAHTVLGCCYGQMSMRFNTGTGAFVLASKDSADNASSWAIELDSQGEPVGSLVLASDQTSTGFMHPTVAANAADKQFGLVHTQSFVNGYIRILQGGGPLTTPGPAKLSVSMSANQAAPYTEGTTVTWTAAASGGNGSILYQFWRYTEGAGWTVAQPWSAVNTFGWAPTTGTHAVQVWVKNSDSVSDWDAWAGSDIFTVNTPSAKLSSLQANAALPVAPNTTVTWSATPATGGSFEYKFWRYAEGSGWTVVQDWGPFNTFTWIVSPGRYAIQAWIRRTGSSANYEDWMSTGFFEVIGAAPARMTSIVADRTFPSAPSNTITWTAGATGGSAPLEYKFWLYSSATATWTVLRDWAPGNQVSWTPGLATGQFALQAWVRSQGSGASYEDWQGTDFFVVTTSTDLTMVTDRPLAGLREGQAVTWTAAMSGPGDWEYRVWTFDGSVWTIQRDYAAANTFTWYPTAGTRAVQIWGRQAGSNAKYERWVSSGFFTVQIP